jgi:site-specific recombinase XerD
VTKRVSEFIRAAQAHADSRKSRGTRYLYKLDLGRWLAWCSRNRVDPAAPTLRAAVAFRDSLEDEQSPQSIRRILTALSSMYAHAIEFEPDRPRATCNPFKPAALPRPTQFQYSQTEALSDEDAEKVIAAVADDGSPIGIRDLAILLLLYETGLRVSSIAAMKMSDLFQRGGDLLARVIVKGGKVVEVPVPARTRAALERWLSVRDEGLAVTSESSKFVFPSVRSRGHITTKAVNGRLAAYGKLAEVEHVHPHRFRASFVTSALDAGEPLHEVQAAVHHTDPKTTLRYDRGRRGTGVAGSVAEFRKERK